MERAVLVALALAACGEASTPGGGPDATSDPLDTGETGTSPLPDDPPEDVPPPPVAMDGARGRYADPVLVTFGDDLVGAELRVGREGYGPEEGEALDTLLVDTTTVLRVGWVTPEGAVVGVEGDAHTFLFAEHVPQQQPPADLPDAWWVEDPLGPYDADYVLDPTVVSDPRTAEFFPGVFDVYPVLSIVLPPSDLFGPNGIHENPTLEGILWERAASFEWLDPVDPELHHGRAAGLRVQGGSSREPSKSPKKSFRIRFGGDYGGGDWDFDAFGVDSAVTSFDTVVLRGRYNRSWTHFDPVQRDRALYVREQLGADLQRAMGHPSSHTRPVHLFLDGLYWGMYLLEERPDEHFASAYLGGDKDDWDVLNTGVVVNGDRVEWEAMMSAAEEDLTDPDHYAAVVDRLELDAFIDYMLLNLYLGNIDWPDRNWYAAHDDLVGRWHFFNWDTELVMTLVDTYQLDSIDHPDTPGHLFTRLRDNPAFRERVAERAALWFDDGGELTPEPLIERWLQLTDEVRPGAVAESARWGDHLLENRGDPLAERYTVPDHWDDERQRNIDDYFPFRTQAFVDQLIAADLYTP